MGDGANHLSVRGAAAAGPIDLQPLDGVLRAIQDPRGSPITVLQRAQDLYGYLPGEVLRAISRRTRVPLSHLYGIATFYAQFRLQRRGRHLVRVCDGTACHVRGAAKNLKAIEDRFQIRAGGTSGDGRVTLEIVYCLGSCGLSPVAVVDDQVCGRLSPEALLARVDRLDGTA